ncbi:MAG: hypothetical protein ACRC20_03185 [Segniliparus sp.]|uniref:hypothetical protein n=1 Tax=Segniliparus sp. TaxID=2804064 RepID=UPI003F3D313C
MTVSPSIASQRQAQETFYHYMLATLQQLPHSATLDNHRYSAGGVVQCDDRIDQLNAPITYYDHFDTLTPPGTDLNTLITQTGDIWKSWGWKVEERDGNKPNRYGTSPDGYTLRIEAAYPAGYPPTLGGHSPCFPASLRDDDVPRPRVITKDGLQYS